MTRRDSIVSALLAIVIIVGLVQGKLDTTGVAFALIALLGGGGLGILAKSKDKNDESDS